MRSCLWAEKKQAIAISGLVGLVGILIHPLYVSDAIRVHFVQVMDCSETMAKQGWKYTMEVTFLEIYNETIRDLLAPRGVTDKKLEIKRSGKGSTMTGDQMSFLHFVKHVRYAPVK